MSQARSGPHLSKLGHFGRTSGSRRVEAFFARPTTALALSLLICLWCALTLAEMGIGRDSIDQKIVGVLSDVLTLVFVVELGVRYWASASKRRFFRDFWSDLLSLVPGLFVPGLLGATPLRPIRLLRLLRLLRLVELLRQHPKMADRVASRGSRQFGVLLGLAAITVFAGAAARVAFEGGTSDTSQFVDALWFSLFSLLAEEPVPGPPATFGARVVSLVLMLIGMASFAVVTGTVSAVMVNRFRKERVLVDWESLENHLILCGWNRKAEIIVGEYVAAHAREDGLLPVVVITKPETEPHFFDESLREHVQFLSGDYTQVSVLERAGARRAAACILLADAERGERESDALTVLAALTIEKLNPSVYTCAELHRSENKSHLELGHVDAYVVSGEHSAFMLAQSVLNRSVFGVLTELLTFRVGSHFARVDVPESWFGEPFNRMVSRVNERSGAILVGVESEGRVQINPRDHVFEEGDAAVLISAHDWVLDEHRDSR